MVVVDHRDEALGYDDGDETTAVGVDKTDGAEQREADNGETEDPLGMGE